MQDPADRRNVGWLLLGLGVWVLTVPLLASLTHHAAAAFAAVAAWLALPIAYAAVAHDPRGCGITFDNLGAALGDALLLTALYTVLRVGVIALVPAAAAPLAGNVAEVAAALRQVEFGTWAGPPARTFVLVLGLAFPVAAGSELFYRGFLLTRIQRSTHWSVALVASALLFGAYHYTVSGPGGFAVGGAMGLFAGWLMVRHRNVVAPVVFHYLQYVAAVLLAYAVLP